MFRLVRQVVAPGAKSTFSDCILFMLIIVAAVFMRKEIKTVLLQFTECATFAGLSYVH